MVQRINFTVERVANFQCASDKTQTFFRDARTPGLGLRVTKGGARTYIFEARVGNQTLRRKLGDARTMLLKEAQSAAIDLKRLTDAKIDPRELDRQAKANQLSEDQRQKVLNAPALDAWRVYIQASQSVWSERYKSDHDTVARPAGGKITRGKRAGMPDTKEQGILRPILELPLSAITRTEVESWVEKERSRRAARVRLALSMLSAFLNWCSDYVSSTVGPDGVRTEIYPYRDQVNENVCRRIKKKLGPSVPKKDALQVEQLPAWFKAVQQISNRTQSAYLQCLLLTGARRNELAGLRWEDVNLEWKTITIRDKVEGTRTIPVTPHVDSLLRELQVLNNTPPETVSKKSKHDVDPDNEWVPSPWVFSSPTSGSGRLEEPRIAHNRALQAFGLPPLSIHGLRRSFGSLAEWVECPAGISAQIMGHKPNAIAEKHYRQRSIDLLRVWHTKIESWILERGKITSPSERNIALPLNDNIRLLHKLTA